MLAQPNSSLTRNRLDHVRRLWRDSQHFTREELWDLDLATLPRMKKLLFSLLRIVGIVIKGFIADNCALQSSALTYITLVSMVPVMAVALSVSKGLGAQHQLMNQLGIERVEVEAESAGALPPSQGGSPAAANPPPEIRYLVIPDSRLDNQPIQFQQIVTQLFEYVDKTDFSALGAMGLLLLFYTVVSVMGKIEGAFNVIWGVRGSRSLLRRFADFTIVLIVAPILILAATSVTAALSSSQFESLMRTHLGPFHWFYAQLIHLMGFLSVFVAFGFLYVFMPNTKVRLVPATVAGVCAGGLWMVAWYLYVKSLVGVAGYNAIYGTFAIIPIFLFWLYLSWMIVLFGAEVCFAVQNYTTYVKEREALAASYATRSVLGLVVTHEACRAFCGARPPWSAPEFGRQHAIPTRLMAEVLRILTERHILLAVAGQESCYVPARDPAQLTPADVEEALRGEQDTMVRRVAEKTSPAVGAILAGMHATCRAELANRSFHDLVAQPAA